jgi:CRP-like cAMP-binding protein
MGLCRKLKYEFQWKGNYVFEYGDAGNTFYIVMDGRVGVEAPVNMDSQEAPENPKDMPLVEVMTIGNGGSFGELALLKEAPRFASVVCKKN